MTALALRAIVRRCWWAVPMLVLAGLALTFRAQRDDTRQTLTTERAAWTHSIDQADRARADQERGFAVAIAKALDRQAARTAAREPIILHSTNTVRKYAQTDAGRARCLDAGRVRGLDAFHAALAGADPGAADSGAQGVRADPDSASAGR